MWTDDDLVFEHVGPALRGLDLDRLLVAPDPDLGLTSLDVRRVVDFLIPHGANSINVAGLS